ncbi:MAG TPA: NUDIX hydrolase N-terminal domain-containing protein, partial [Natrialbaceae archaeon]|nr:NUDIX hydrolase N-terminal domain-containing protein [Natrialbaceae archaeon]
CRPVPALPSQFRTRNFFRAVPESAPMEILALLDELRAMARTGLNFTDDPYDEERYERMLELVDQYYGRTLDRPPEAVRDRLADELGQVTPKVGALAAIFDEDGRILLIKRSESGAWCLPGGAMELHETPEEAAVREAREETGLDVRVDALIGAYRRGPARDFPFTTVLLSHHCTVTGGTLELSHEGDDLQYWAVEDVPDWFLNHEAIAVDARESWRD